MHRNGIQSRATPGLPALPSCQQVRVSLSVSVSVSVCVRVRACVCICERAGDGRQGADALLSIIRMS